MTRRTLILPLGGGLDPTDYYNKQEVDQLLSAKETSADLAAVAESGSYNDLSNKPLIGSSLSLTMDSSTFVMTAQLLDQNGDALGSAQTVDLPMESVVVNGAYDDQTKKIILTLQNGNTIEFSVADLVSGLQSEITAQNPLSADLVADGTTNKVFTATEQSKLANIEAGAQVNVKPDWNAASGTAAEILNKPTIPTSTSQLTNDSGFITQNDVLAYKAFPSGWHTTGTMADLISDIAADSNATEGMSYMDTVSFSDLPAGLLQGEIQVDIMSDVAGLGKNVLFTLTSSNQSPYHWEYTSAYGATGTWRSWVPDGTLATVATTGSYDDLTNKPTIPAAQVQSDWNQSDNTAVDYIKNKPEALANPTEVPALVNDGIVIKDVLTDYDGNTYDGVVLNNQIWMMQNLKVTHWRNGDAMEEFTMEKYMETLNTTHLQMYAYPNGDSGNVDTFGLLYPINYTVGKLSDVDIDATREVAPEGWHIPTKAEWDAMQSYVLAKYSDLNSDKYVNSDDASLYTYTTNYTNDTKLGFVPAGEWLWYSASSFGEFIALMQAPDNGVVSPYITVGGRGYSVMTTNMSRTPDHCDSVRCVMDATATQWFADNRSRLYLKDTSNGMVWYQLAAVAESGSYNDLTNKPTIPAAQVNSDWNASSGVAEILNKPTIPTVNDATITVRQEGQADQTFTLNQSSNATIDIAAGGGGNEWYGSQAQFNAIHQKDADTNYFISDKLDYNTDLKNTPDLSSYATKSEMQTADSTLNSKIGAKMEAKFMTAQEFGNITPKEGENYFIQGETVAMTFTLQGGITVTYNVVVD